MRLSIRTLGLFLLLTSAACGGAQEIELDPSGKADGLNTAIYGMIIPEGASVRVRLRAPTDRSKLIYLRGICNDHTELGQKIKVPRCTLNFGGWKVSLREGSYVGYRIPLANLASRALVVELKNAGPGAASVGLTSELVDDLATCACGKAGQAPCEDKLISGYIYGPDLRMLHPTRVPSALSARSTACGFASGDTYYNNLGWAAYLDGNGDQLRVTLTYPDGETLKTTIDVASTDQAVGDKPSYGRVLLVEEGPEGKSLREVKRDEWRNQLLPRINAKQ